MRARKRLVVAVAAAMLSGPTLGSAGGSAAAAAGPVVKGDTTLTARRTSVVAVTLPRPARIDLHGFLSDDVTSKGRGRVFGAVFVRAGEGSVLLGSLTFSRCDSPGCLPARPFRQEQMVFASGAKRLTPETVPQATFEIPAGRYYAHIFTDGAPVSVRFRLAGLTGRTTITATAPHTAVVKEAEPTLPDIGAVYSAGASAPARGPLTLMAHVITQRSQPHIEHIENTCYYHDSTPPGGHVLPGCPGGSSGYLFDIGYVTLDYQSVSYGYVLTRATGDTWYQGAYVDGAQGPSEFSTTFFWSDLRT